jgi:hypothetical protein
VIFPNSGSDNCRAASRGKLNCIKPLHGLRADIRNGQGISWHTLPSSVYRSDRGWVTNLQYPFAGRHTWRAFESLLAMVHSPPPALLTPVRRQLACTWAPVGGASWPLEQPHVKVCGAGTGW